MIENILKDRPAKLFIGFTAFFVANALIAESIGTKLFSLEKLLGLHQANFTVFGQSGMSFVLTCGVLLWPLEFVMTDIVNEYYGPKAVRRMSLTAVVLISYAFIMYFLSIKIPPADIWLQSSGRQGVPNIQDSYNAIFGQNMRIIIGSLVAFLVSQAVDVTVFHKIKKITGHKHLWLRATGSTLVSQIVDSYIVLFIAFSGIFSWQLILAVGVMNYTFKAISAILLTPIIYIVEGWIEKYVGHATAEKMKLSAMGVESE
jgi:queuosine precursor transporter